MSIYFLEIKTNGAENYIKIGFSNNPQLRIQTLQTASPFDMKILKIISGQQKDEQLLHNQFKHLQINREWFRAEDELLEYIDKLDYEDNKVTNLNIINNKNHQIITDDNADDFFIMLANNKLWKEYKEYKEDVEWQDFKLWKIFRKK